MMNDEMKYIIARIIENAKDALNEHKQNKDDLFADGKSLAYYEVLDIIKGELETHDQDLKEFGLDVDLEKEFL